MFNLAHNSHLIFHLLVQHPVLHELPLVELLRCERLATKPQCHFVYRRESASADLAHAVVLVRAVPWPR